MAGFAEVLSKGKVYREVILIFLTVGTWRIGYDRLVKAVDELAGSGVVTEEIIAQTGYGSYKPKNMTVIDFCSPDEFIDLVSKAKLVISHAGIGTIIETVKQNKPIIAVPRKAEFGEVDNNHQFVTAKHLQEEGKIIVAYEVDELPDKLREAENFVPVQGKGTEKILRTVQDFIDEVAAKKFFSSK